MADDSYHGEPLITIQGTLTAPANPPIGPGVSIAIFWMSNSPSFHIPGDLLTPKCDGNPFPARTGEDIMTRDVWVNQSVQYDAEFPIHFKLPLTKLPPAEARLDLGSGGEGTISMGFLVVYQDLDKDGEYDFGTQISDPEPILATLGEPDEIIYLYFLNGRITATLDFPPGWELLDSLPKGFSFVIIDSSSFTIQSILPADTPIELNIQPDMSPYLTYTIGCHEQKVTFEYLESMPPEAEPVCVQFPGGATHFYSWTEEEYIEGCQSYFRGVAACLDPDTPAPDDWPCP
jgi:hypothetical protein